MFGGKCTLEAYAERSYNASCDSCRDCRSFGVPMCDVVDGRESGAQCEIVQEYVRFEGITLYGRARRAMKGEL